MNLIKRKVQSREHLKDLFICLLIYLFIYLKCTKTVRGNKRKTETEKDLLPLGSSTNVCLSQGWTKLKVGARNSI